MKNKIASVVLAVAMITAGGVAFATPGMAVAGSPAAANRLGVTDPEPARVIDGVEVTVSGVTTRVELNAFLLSDAPKTLVVDSATGATRSVEEGEPLEFRIGNHKVCNSGDACLKTSTVPYADWGFSGSPGTTTGSWLYRIQWKTGKYTAKTWYKYRGALVGFGPKLGPNSTVNMTSPVTGAQVTIYS
jgi:hypothetical protein